MLYIIFINTKPRWDSLTFSSPKKPNKDTYNHSNLDAKWIHLRLSRSHGMDLCSEGSRQNGRCYVWSFPGPNLGTLSRSHLPLPKIQRQQTTVPTRHNHGNNHIIQSCIVAGDYFFTGRRRGANELFANRIYMNNNLFLANLDSLVYCYFNADKILISSQENSPHNKSKHSTSEETYSGQIIITLKIRNGFIIPKYTLQRSSKKE